MSDSSDSEDGVAKNTKLEEVVAVAAAVAPEERKEYWLALDLERLGPEYAYGVLAIGVCFGTPDGTVLDARAFCGRVPEQSGFDAYCWSSFWSKFPDVLARIDSEAQDDHVLACYRWLCELEAKYGPFGRRHAAQRKLVLLSDNPAYDFGVLGAEIAHLRGRAVARPISEMFDDYVPTDDPGEQLTFASAEQRERVFSYVTAPHDHYPANDATQIFQMRAGIRAVTGK
jgi:hypothetical protein